MARQITIERDRWNYGDAGVVDKDSLLLTILINLGLTRAEAEEVEAALDETQTSHEDGLDPEDIEGNILPCLEAAGFEVTFSGEFPDVDDPADDACDHADEEGNYCSNCGACLP